jgi:DNA-binding IclR family transcriptional regulator
LERRYYYINSVEKAVRVLELLADKDELSVTKVAEYLGLNRPSSHRFLATLRELGYVERNAESRYQLTFKMLELGMKKANRFEIRRVARPFMQELASMYNETVNLGFFDGRDIVHLDKIDSREILRMDPGIGMRAPAYCTALGKSILAFLPREDLRAYLESVALESHTPKTFCSKEELVDELERVRRQEFSVDDEELSQGLRCVAAPVFDYSGYPRYSLSVSGPTGRMTYDRIRQMQADVRRVCTKLSTALGEPRRTKQDRAG